MVALAFGSGIEKNKPYAITAYEDLQILNGVALAIDRLKDVGFVMIVVSNQPGVAAGIMALPLIRP